MSNKVAPLEEQASPSDKRASLKEGRQSVQYTRKGSQPFQSRQSLKRTLREGSIAESPRSPSPRRLSSQRGGKGGLPKRRESVLPDIFNETQKAKSKCLPKSQYPEVVPPKTRRHIICNDNIYYGLDTFVSKVPTLALYGDFDDVAGFLTRNCTTDVDKCRALFSWITSIDIRHLQSTLQEIPSPGTPLDYLLHINWKKGNLPSFFAKICRAAGIPTIVVNGMTKNAAYELGGRCDRTQLAAQWNAVYVSKEWRLVDVFWGCRCVIDPRAEDWVEVGKESLLYDLEGDPVEGEYKHQRNLAYFLMEPDQMIYTHFPDDEKWQLLSVPVSVHEFSEFPYIRERFHQMDMTLIGDSKHTCINNTKWGQIDFVFAIPQERSKNFRFKCIVFAHANQENDDVRFDQYVFYQKMEDSVRFSITFPIPGLFKLHIYGLDQTKDSKFDLCIAYLINCQEAAPKAEPLPDVPEIGWGVGSELYKLGLVPETNERPLIETKDGNVEIRFSITSNLHVKSHLKSPVGDDLELQKYVMTHVANKEVIITLRLPLAGDYALNIHGAELAFQGELPNICNFLIKSSGGTGQNSFPRLHEGGLGRGKIADEFSIYPKSHPEEVIFTEDAHLAVEFEVRASEQDIQDTQLFSELQSNDINGKGMAEHVTYKKEDASHVFLLVLPKKGEYAMNVYARKKSDSDSVHHVFTYMIISSQTTEGEYDKNAKVVQPVYQTVRTKKGKKKIRLPTTGLSHVVDFVRRKAKEVIKYEVKGNMVGNDFLFEVKLPVVAEYVLDVFEEYKNTLVLVAEYYIIREPLNSDAPLPPEPPPVEDFPSPKTQDPEKVAELARRANEADAKRHAQEEAKIKEMEEKERNKRTLHQKLTAALTSEDPNDLPPALNAFETNRELMKENKDLYEKAKLEMKINPFKQELAQAIGNRNYEELSRAIKRVEGEKLAGHLGLQYHMAVKIRDKLSAIGKLCADISKVNQKDIVELRSYERPPLEVHFVLSATYMVLGETERAVRDWRDVVIQTSKTGDNSLKKRIQNFDFSRLTIKTAKRALMMIEQYTLEQVAMISHTLVLIYIWTKAMAEECVTQFARDGGDLNEVNVARKKKKHISPIPGNETPHPPEIPENQYAENEYEGTDTAGYENAQYENAENENPEHYYEQNEQ